MHSDAQVPFVPEMPDNLVVPMDSNGVPISCRVSNPHSHVTLRSVSTGEEMSAFYDNKMGFFGMLAPGQYQCETVVNGQMFRSDIYMVENDSKWGMTYPALVKNCFSKCTGSKHKGQCHSRKRSPCVFGLTGVQGDLTA